MRNIIGNGGLNGVSFVSGAVDEYADLPTPASAYSGTFWLVRDGSGGLWTAFGAYKYPRGLYAPNSSDVWEQVPFNVKVAEDSSTLVNITNWTQFTAYVIDISAGDRLIYNDIEYRNRTGTIGTAPSGDTTNWEPATGVWDDLRFPYSGSRLDISSGRLDYDFFNGGVGFAANARYPEEPISMICQMPHAWIEGSEIRPHFHWLQQSSDIPNWLLAYKIHEKDTASAIETDFSNFTLDPWQSNSFTYTSGVLNQITSFSPITMTGYGLSDIIHFVLFRDTTNVSTEFTGADPSSLVEINQEFDVHFQTDQPGGSRLEFTK